jgi:Secretion system C-terminal sorting domain/CUB domain
MNRILRLLALFFVCFSSFCHGQAPTGLIANALSASSVSLSWVDNSPDETSFVIERSLRPTDSFVEIQTVGAGISAYTDAGLTAGIYYYRVKAVINGNGTGYTKTTIALSVTPLVMSRTTVSTCNKVFLDPGGLGDYTPQNSVMTISSGEQGKKVRVAFSYFDLNPTDVLLVFDGENIQAPKVGEYTGAVLPPSINATGASGALTFQLISTNTGFGWQANLSCENVPVFNGNLAAAPVSGTEIRLTWQDNATQGGYIIERKLSGRLFEEIVRPAGNAREYIDQGLVTDNTYSYRLRALNGAAYSTLSNTATATLGAEPLVMVSGEFTICDRPFLDPGDNGPYAKSKHLRTTLRPSMPGSMLKLDFTAFDLGQDGKDVLRIFDGSSVFDGPLIGEYTGQALPPSIIATNPNGVLTFEFVSDDGITGLGWRVNVTCSTQKIIPTNFSAQGTGASQVRLSWQDNANNETEFVVERRTIEGDYQEIAHVGANELQYDDIGLQTNEIYVYRLRVVCTGFSGYSNVAAVTLGSRASFTMRNGEATTCNSVFLDSGFEQNYGLSQNYTLTINPGAPGESVKVDFLSFDLEEGYDSLIIYNGGSVQAPKLGKYSSNTLPPTAIAFNPEGKLTFKFTSDDYVTLSGWEALISCVTRLNAPTNLQAQLAGNQINLAWQDNTNDETGYVVERATTNDQFIAIATLPPGAQAHVDPDLRMNREHKYRVYAVNNGLLSLSSNISSVLIGKKPEIMRKGTVSTCDGVFLDPGGDSNYPQTNFFDLTITPSEPGKKIEVKLTSFDLNPEKDDFIVFDGNLFVDWPWYESAQALPHIFQATNPEGKLTFWFRGRDVTNKPGWEATISCVTKGAPLIAFPDKTIDYVDPLDGLVSVKATAYPSANFTFSVVDDGTNTAQATIAKTGLNTFSVRPGSIGTVKIKALLTENADFLAAEKIMTLTIQKGAPPINFLNQGVTFGNAPLSLRATIGTLVARDANFTYEVVADPGNTGQVTLSGTGNRVVAPDQAGVVKIKASLAESNFFLAGEKEAILTVRKATPVISFSDKSSTMNNPSFDLDATAYANADFVYGIINENAGGVVLSGAGNKTVTLLGPGRVRVKAFLRETDEFLSAEKTATLTIHDPNPVITFADMTHTYGDASFDLNAAAYDGASFVYSVVNDGQSTGEVNLSGAGGKTVTIRKAGIVKLKAANLGENDNVTGEKVSTLTINKATQEMEFEVIPDMLVDASPYVLSSKASSGLKVAYTVKSGPASIVSTLISDMILLSREVGTVTIEATQSGNENYQPAVPLQQSFSVIRNPDPILGVEDEDTRDGNVMIWPVPASDRMNINSRVHEIIGFSLIDALGRVVVRETLSIKDYQLDVKLLDEGVYTLRLQLEDGSFVIRRIQIVN